MNTEVTALRYTFVQWFRISGSYSSTTVSTTHRITLPIKYPVDRFGAILSLEIGPTAFSANPISDVTYGDMTPIIEITVTKINTSYSLASIFTINGIQFGY